MTGHYLLLSTTEKMSRKVGETEMNLIDYNQAVEALERERQLLLNREQYGAENVLVHHALNVIAELPIIRQPEIVQCKDCKYYDHFIGCMSWHDVNSGNDNWYCANGERKEGR